MPALPEDQESHHRENNFPRRDATDLWRTQYNGGHGRRQEPHRQLLHLLLNSIIAISVQPADMRTVK